MKLKKIRYNAPVVLTFTLIAFVVLIIGYFTGTKSTQMFFTVYRTSFADPMQYVRLFTHVLGHADFQHFSGNFMIILIIAPMLEEKYGSRNILLIIIFTAFITGLFNVLLFNTGLLGASGIAFTFILLGSFVNVKDRNEIPLTLIIVAAFYIGNEIVAGIFTKDNISQITHIIGGICGCVFGYILNTKKNESV